MELVELGEAIIHIFEGQVGCADPSALIDLPGCPGGVFLDLIQRWGETPGSGPARRMVEDVDGLLGHVLGPFSGREEVGPRHRDRYVVIEQVGWLGYPPRGLIVLCRQGLRPVLRPVPFWE